MLPLERNLAPDGRFKQIGEELRHDGSGGIEANVRSIRIVFVGLAAALGCGSSESSSNFTTCQQSSSCRAGLCSFVERCQVDECESKLSYEFEGEEFKSMCTFGPTVTTTVFPPEGGPGTTRIERNVQECFYKAEVEFNDFDEVRRCTRVQDCTLQQLSCNTSDASHPKCSVVSEAPC